jgi:CRP/FNR family transcriptional regulator
MNRVAEPNWRNVLPELAKSADEITCQLLDSSKVMSLKQNSTVFHQGDACSNYLIILNGKIKVFTRAENGREILLYRLFQGDY